MKLKRGIALACAVTMLGSGIPYNNINTYAEDTEWKLELSEENFPDARLLSYISSKADANDDGFLTEQEIDSAFDGNINLPSYNIKDLTGLEKLTGIINIMANNNPIEKVDLSDYKELSWFTIYSPLLKELDVSNPVIKSIGIHCKNINNIIWGDKSKFDRIDISGSCISSFEPGNFSYLRVFFIDETDISTINLKDNSRLFMLGCSATDIQELDVSQNTQLGSIMCGGSHLVQLDLSNNINLQKNSNINLRFVRSKTGISVDYVYTPQQVYFVAKQNPSGTYSVAIDGVSDSTRMLNVTSGTKSGNVITWNSLSEVPSTFSYQYDTKCPKNEYISEEAYLDVSVHVVRPADITGITDVSGDGVTVNWTSEQTEDDVTWEVPVSYEIYRSTSQDGEYTKVGTASGDATSYTDTSVESGNTYYYNVKTVKDTYKGKLTSEHGEDVAVTIEPEVVNIKSVTQSGTDKAVISWEEAEGAKEYEVYRSESMNGTYGKIAAVTGTSYTDTGLTYGKTYYYKIISKSGNLTSESYSSVMSVQIKPLAPTGLELTQNINKVKISWKKTEGATGYEVYRSATKDGQYQLIKDTTGNSYTDQSVKYGDNFYYKVRAYTKLGSGRVYGAFTAAKSIEVKPGETTKNISVASYNSLKISWDKMSGVSGYEIRRSEKSNGTYKKIAEVTGTRTSYTDKELTCGKAYYYKVVPYIEHSKTKEYGGTGTTISGKTRPNATSISSVKRTNYNKLTVSYTKASGATGYAVYRSTTSNGTYKKIATVTETSYVDTVTCGTTYYYKVRALAKVDGTNVYSNTYSSVKSGKATLSKPVIKLSAGSKKATVTWEKVSGANGYEIYMSTKKASGYKKIKTAAAKTLKYTKSKLTTGKRYYFKIRAYRKVNNKKVYSAWSSIKSVKVK